MANAKLDDAVFAVEVANHQLLRLAYDSYLAASRQVGAKTKTRGEVRGGGIITVNKLLQQQFH